MEYIRIFKLGNILTVADTYILITDIELVFTLSQLFPIYFSL